MTLADMLVVMNAGQVEQIGAPLDVYERPATTFVAAFIGAPPMNLLRMQPAEFNAVVGASSTLPAEGAIVGVRPEDLDLAPGGAPPDGRIALALTVEAVEQVGPESFVYGSLERGGDVIVRLAGKATLTPGAQAVAVADRNKLHVFAPDGRQRLDAS